MNNFSIKFDAAMMPVQPEVFLAKRDLSLVGALPVTDFTVHDSTTTTEISFTVHKNIDGVKMSLWDQVDDLGIVYLRDGDAYFEITSEIDETEETTKKVTGRSLCESELSQIVLYDLEINSESDIARDDYTKASVFYNPNDTANSLLHRVLEKAPHYKIAHVDTHLQKMVRSFSENDVTIYDFLTDTVAKELDCVFVFNSSARSISVYDLEDYCVDCGERIGIADVCPICGGTNIQKGYGDDTAILIASQNLADSLTRTGDTDSVKNCFKLEAGDDLMTATLANINPNGTLYIYHFSAAQKASMPAELRNKLNSYDALYQSQLSKYKDLNQQWYDLTDELLSKQTSMMPASTDSGTSAAKELAKLTASNLSPVAVSNPSKASKTSVDNAVLAYAKVYVRGTYKVTIDHSSYSGTTWKGAFTVTLYGDDTDTATGTSDISITVTGDEEKFIKQRIDKALKQYEKKDEEYDWTKYSLDMLSSYETAYQGVIDALIELGVSESSHEFYKTIYLPYHNKLNAIRSEMKVREKEITSIKAKIKTVEKNKKAINQKLDIKAYLGTELWLTLYSYRREQTYSNDNFISDGLDNTEVVNRAEEFFKTAQKELITASRVQYSLSCNMHNLLVRQEFKPLWSKFRLYNWLRMQIDGEIHRMRLTSYQINYEQIDSLSVEFSDAVQTADGFTDLQSLLDKAQSMATSYEYVARQATKGKQANTFLENWFQNGLDATTVKVVNDAQNQSVIIDGHGVLSRRYDDEADAYANEQTKLLNAGLYITSDNWRSTDTAVGRFYYRDTNSGELKEAYGVNARVLVGQLILGEQMQITNSKGSLSFNENGLRVSNGMNAFTVDPSTHNMVQIQKIDKDGNYTPQLYIDTNGYVHFADGTVIGSGSVIQGASIGNGTSISGDVSIDLGAITVPTKDASGKVVNKTFMQYLDADVANIISLQADSAIINALKTNYLDAGVVNADIANIKTIMAGNIGTGELVAINLTAQNVNIDDAVIQDLIAKKITALDLTSGSINTKDFTIQSDEGKAGLKIVGNTLQMYDKNGNPGVQLGYDSKGTPSLILTDANGAIMLDSTGLHDEIVPNQFIKTGMVADKAITNGKIDWSGISDGVDEDGNPVWSAARVKVGDQGLDAKFTETTTKINSLSGQIDNVLIVGANCFTKEVGGVLSPEEIVLSAVSKNEAVISKWVIDGVEITQTESSAVVPWVGTGKMTLTIPRDYMTTRRSITVELYGTSSKEGASNDLRDVTVVYRVQDGQSVQSITTQYATTQSSSKAPTSGWSETAPTWTSGTYIWTRFKIVYANPSSTQYTTPVCDTAWEAATEVDKKVSSLQKKVSLNEALALAASCALEYSDYAFETGYNNVVVYNTKATDAVTLKRISTDIGGEDSLPTKSGHYLEVTTAEGETSPELGGIRQPIRIYSGAKYVIRYLLKLPSHCTIHAHGKATSLGDGTRWYWVTDTVGTGDWQEYVLVVEVGQNPSNDATIGCLTISSTTSDRPIKWQIGAIWAVNTAYTVDIQSTVSAQIRASHDSIIQEVRENNVYVVTDKDGNQTTHSIEEKISNIESTATGIEARVKSLTTYTDADGNKCEMDTVESYVNQTATDITLKFVDQALENYESYIQFSSGANGEPQMTLGKSDSDDIRLCLYNDQVSMVNGNGDKLTWWTDDAFNCIDGNFTKSVTVGKSLTVGAFRWRTTTHTYNGTTYDRMTLIHI